MMIFLLLNAMVLLLGDLIVSMGTRVKLSDISLNPLAPRRLPENVHLLRYPHPSSLQRTAMYASFLGISEALHLDAFKQPSKK